MNISFRSSRGLVESAEADFEFSGLKAPMFVKCVARFVSMRNKSCIDIFPVMLTLPDGCVQTNAHTHSNFSDDIHVFQHWY